MDFLTYWGQWIHSQRKNLGYTPEEFARLTHISSNQIYHIEHGQGDSRKDTLDKLFEILDSDQAYQAILSYVEPSLEPYITFIQAIDQLDPKTRRKSMEQILSLLS